MDDDRPGKDEDRPRGFGQFCAAARALEVLGERWTLLVVREMLLGSTRFSQFQQGLPRISRTMLSARLKTLQRAGVAERLPDGGYRLTGAGRALRGVVAELGGWATEWDRRPLRPDHLDPQVLAFDMHRRVHLDRLPGAPTVVELRLRRTRPERFFLHTSPAGLTLCSDDLGLPVDLRVQADLAALTAWWTGDLDWDELLRTGAARLDGSDELCRAFPTWFRGYAFAPQP
ncbi:winged helix-turn-helix transcriptional regulator [Kitasatospora viridis]|uniref:HxlR family transcriptional regulator n=1 Tax=Kitasatospora viridis TaxID=281105 RepID=A0A561SE33_9ACTN|nr:helix-turn-helix domain-containing protein [Kitasatospora viridis]TWF73129.1 HxlR family transcriptional regulator [Kitasatospora viridis]